jgi:hypothetical protein
MTDVCKRRVCGFRPPGGILFGPSIPRIYTSSPGPRLTCGRGRSRVMSCVQPGAHYTHTPRPAMHPPTHTHGHQATTPQQASAVNALSCAYLVSRICSPCRRKIPFASDSLHIVQMCAVTPLHPTYPPAHRSVWRRLSLWSTLWREPVPSYTYAEQVAAKEEAAVRYKRQPAV